MCKNVILQDKADKFDLSWLWLHFYVEIGLLNSLRDDFNSEN